MENSNMHVIPEATRKRLVLLTELLESWKNERITSIEMSNLLNCKDSLVRYDLRFVEAESGFKNGYSVQSLKESVEKSLNGKAAEKKRCCIVGLGRLGAALLDSSFFEGSGFEISAGFDSSVNRVELLRSTFELFPASRIETVCAQKKIGYAFLSCPENEAEKMVQRLVNAGIRGIVNYTRCVFAVPQGVKVENASPVLALQNLQ